MDKERSNNFTLINLINPAYMYSRIKGIRSFGELRQRFNDLFILFLKILTFRYGAAYWEKKEKEKLAKYIDESDKIEEVGVYCEMGEYYFGRKDYEEALKVYNRILKLDKDNKTAYFRIGDMKYAIAEYDGALAEYKKAIQLAKGDKEYSSMIYNKTAQIYLEQGKLDLALEEINKAIGYDKNNEHAYKISGNIFMQKKEYEKALKEYEKVLELEKGNKKAESAIYSEIAQVYWEEGKLDLAVQEIKKSLEHDKHNELAFRKLSRIYRDKKEYKKALAEYKRSLELAKGDKKAESAIYSEIAQVYLDEKNYNRAIQEANKAIEHDRYNEYAYNILGDIYRQNKEYEKALKKYKEALELAKGSKEKSIIYCKIAQVSFEIGKYDLALEEIKKALEYDKYNGSAYRTLAGIYRQNKEYEKALIEYRKALELANGDKKIESEICSDLARVYLDEGKYDLALEEIKKAIEHDKNNENAYRISGDIYCRKKQYDEALNEFDKALKLPGCGKECISGIYNERAQIYFKQGKHSHGISELNRSTELDPKNIVTHLLMGSGYKFQDKYKEALSEFVKAMGLSKDDKESKEKIYFEIIGLLKYANVKGSHSEAFKIALEALKLNYTDNAMILNSLTNELEIAQKATKLNSRVRNLAVNLTNQCNLECTMCFARQTPKQEISRKVKEEIIKTFPYLEYIDWLGGEVFLYPGFAELIDEAIRHPLKQGVITNALLITEELAVKLIKNNFLLSISIDGTTKEVYESIRRGAKYERIIEQLAMINRIRKQFNPGYSMNLNVVVMRSNYRQIESFVDFAKEHNFNILTYSMIAENCNNENIFNYNRDENILSYVGRALDSAGERCGKYGISFNNNITKSILQSSNDMKNNITTHCDENPSQPENVKERSDTGDKKVICTAPWKTLLVDIQGDVIPGIGCFCKYVVGNLNECSIEEIWNGDRMVKYRENIITGNIEKVCDLKQVYNEIPVELPMWQK